ncbi:MAG: acyl carrier protein [Deltaproteobacteria bacterium]|nr:acyl carrier protein [Deltaproteobacteria bacterium]
MTLQDRIDQITTRREALEILSASAQALTPDLSFTVDFFQPADAWGVAQCCCAIYGDGYPVDTYYVPQRLVAETRQGNIHGVVARTERGDVVGFGAVYRSSPPFSGIYEAGQYLIRQEYRNTRAVFEISEFILKMLPAKTGLSVLFTETVCRDLIMQRMPVRKGFTEAGLALDLMPAEAFAKEGGSPGRVAAVLFFKVFKDRPQDLWLPEIYREPVGRCIEEMGLVRSLHSQSETAGLPERSDSTELYFAEAAVARLSLVKAGRDAAQIIADFEATASAKGCQVRQVFLNIGDPALVGVFPALLQRGYFFGGYLPRWFDNDGLLLQKLTSAPNRESINLYSERAKKLLEFIMQDRARAMRGSAV